MQKIDQTIDAIQSLIEKYNSDKVETVNKLHSLLLDATQKPDQASTNAPGSTIVQAPSSDQGKKPKKLYEAAFLVLEQEKEAHVKDLAPKVSKLMRKKVNPQNVYVALEYVRKNKGGISREKGLWKLDKKSH